ncbi:hypothetical protein BDR06DRAFT_966153 [Suillus hirtellus]|nr:hypothetical protein BDR06DRAFT_966153 [Suillus hirtellus]
MEHCMHPNSTSNPQEIHIPEECQGPEHPIQPGVILHSLIKCDFSVEVEVEVFVMLSATRPLGERSATPIRGWDLEGIFLGPGKQYRSSSKLRPVTSIDELQQRQVEYMSRVTSFTNHSAAFVSPLVVLSQPEAKRLEIMLTGDGLISYLDYEQ